MCSSSNLGLAGRRAWSASWPIARSVPQRNSTPRLADGQDASRPPPAFYVRRSAVEIIRTFGGSMLGALSSRHFHYSCVFARFFRIRCVIRYLIQAKLDLLCEFNTCLLFSRLQEPNQQQHASFHIALQGKSRWRCPNQLWCMGPIGAGGVQECVDQLRLCHQWGFPSKPSSASDYPWGRQTSAGSGTPQRCAAVQDSIDWTNCPRFFIKVPDLC